MADVTSPDRLKIEVENIHGRAIADQQAAVVAQQREENDKSTIDAIIASMARHHFTDQDKAIVAALLGPVNTTIKACGDHVNASNAKQAAGSAAVAMADLHISMAGEGAAGTFYQGNGTGRAGATGATN